MMNISNLGGALLGGAGMILGRPGLANKKILRKCLYIIPRPFISRPRGAELHAPLILAGPLTRLVDDFMQEEKIPGMTLAIVQAPYIPRVTGYGLSRAETGLLASTNTLWPAAEISQGYAAIAAFQLVEQGTMEIGDKVSRFVKDLPEAWKNVTILQLLQHSSGIPDYRNSPQYDASRD